MTDFCVQNIRRFFCEEIKDCKIKNCASKCPYKGDDFIKAVNDNGYCLSKVRCIFADGALNQKANEYINKLVEKDIFLVRGC